MSKTALITLLDNVLVFVWGIFFLTLPFIISTATTDSFLLPKEAALAGIVLLSLILWAINIVLKEKVTFRRTPFDLPVILFLLAVLLSSLFAVNRADSLIATVPVILAGFGYFVLVNTLKKENALLYTVSALLIGGALTSLLAIFSYFKIYPLLFSFTHVQSFTPIGSLVEQAFYFAFLLPVALTLSLPILKGKTNNKTVTFSVLAIFLAGGLLVTLLQLFTTQKPVLLPFETGFQTAFAAISQDSGRIAQGFLLGSGYGTFGAVFTRFRQAAFNTTPLWANQFTNSSSFILELLATTGVLGMLSYLFLLFRALNNPSTKKINPLYLGIAVLALISLIFPFSFLEVGLLFVFLGLFAATQALKDTKSYYDVEVKFVALKKGMISLQQISVPSHEKHEYNRSTSIVVALILLIFVVFSGWFGGSFVLSDILFQKALVLAAANNGTGAYKEEAQAITTFPYRSVYYRIFSQTNIALAGSLASIQKGKQPNSQTQNTLYALIQQGITTAKQATALAPQTVAEWQNLSSVYRSLIGAGQNADSFAVLAAQQAVTLDPNNPQEYLALGGIYYQLGQWDNAIHEFQQAAALKQDFANAYYNLGHAYEQKQDYQNALTAYQTVEQLVAGNNTNETTVKNDISSLQAKMGSQNSPANGSAGSPQAPATKTVTPQPTQAPLNLSGQTPSASSGQSPTAGQAATPATVTSPSPAK